MKIIVTTMSATFEESVLDFDINLFQQSSNNALVQSNKEKIRKAIFLSKQKLMSTDSLIRKYYDKRLSCRTLERCLLTSKDEYKQACIESMEYQEKCSVLQDEIKKLQLANRELEEKYVAAENRHDGMQSHARQLELLVKQNETTIESIKIDYNMEKENSKTLEKKSVHLQEENEELTKNICLLRDIVFGKKKITKDVKLMLKIYGKSAADTDESEGVSCNESDTFDNPMSPLSDSGVCNMLTSPSSENNKIGSKDEKNEGTDTTRDDNDHDSECSNEVVSLDTGRGSSLAFSDSDKCFNSPEYFEHHSPLNSDPLRNKVTVEMATSPILAIEFANIATSPIKFKNAIDCNEVVLSESSRKSIIPKIMVDREVSPITPTPVTHCVDMSTNTSPKKALTDDIATSPVKLRSSSRCSNYVVDHTEKEKEFLELNNSDTLEDENSSDSEVQMILHTMRFNKKLITPLPTTPAKSRTIDVSANNATQTVLNNIVCPDAAKLREDNIALQATVAKLAQDVLNINNFLSQFNPSKYGHTILCTKGTSQSASTKYVVDPARSAISCQQQHLDELSFIHHKPSQDKVIENEECHKDKMMKLKEKEFLLFDESSLPNPSDSPPPAQAATLPLASLDTDVHKLNEYESSYNLNSKERLHFEDPLLNQGSAFEYASDSDIYEDEVIIELVPDSFESERNELHIPPKNQTIEDKPTQKTPKPKKLTKLDKLRNRMLPKSKIKNVDTQTKRKRRLQPLRFKAHRNRMTAANKLINNKAAYERACKVMSEIKSKEKTGDTLGNPPRKQGSRQQVCGKTMKPSEHLGTNFNSSESPLHSVVHKTSDESPSVENNNVLPSSQNIQPQITKTISGPVCPANYINIESIEKIYKKISTPHTDTKNSDSSDHRTIKTRSQSKHNYCNNDVDGNTVMRKSLDQNTDTGLSDQPPSVMRTFSRNRGKNKEQNSTKDSATRNDSVMRSNVAVTVPVNENKTVQSETRKRYRRPSDDKPDVAPKRMLRSSSALLEVSAEKSTATEAKVVTYDDLDMFATTIADVNIDKKADQATAHPEVPENSMNPKFSILCRFLDKYAKKSQKEMEPKISENETNHVCQKLEESIADIQKLAPKDVKLAMDELVQYLQGRTTKHLLSGFIKYLKEPNRKIELFNKTCVPPAPPMTKAEQILIYLFTQLKVTRPNVVNKLLEMIEYTLFKINRTPDFDVIETLSHFYAVLCRYEKDRNRLRQFIIDAMYCLQYKSVPLIRQCMEVWMHVLPLAHMGIAKTPLVMCLVYLLHFYKCEDKFNRVQDIRNILNKKYFYEVFEWNETRILEMFRNAILELRDIPIEKKLLRIAIIILAKRHGAKWCQNKIIKNMLLPMIEDAATPDRIKTFCVSLLGPLLKPYPVEMKINCEIAMNQLSDMLNRNPSKEMQEAIFTSFIFMSKHNHNRVIKALLFWSPESVSPELEELLINYVRERNLKSWKTVLSKIPLHKNEQ